MYRIPGEWSVLRSTAVDSKFIVSCGCGFKNFTDRKTKVINLFTWFTVFHISIEQTVFKQLNGICRVRSISLLQCFVRISFTTSNRSICLKIYKGYTHLFVKMNIVCMAQNWLWREEISLEKKKASPLTTSKSYIHSS